MQVKLALSALDVLKANIRVVAVASAMRVLLVCEKALKSSKKGMLSLDLVWIRSRLPSQSLDCTGFIL